MIEIILPDKSKRNFEEPPSIIELAQDIGPGLAKATLAGISMEKSMMLAI